MHARPRSSIFLSFCSCRCSADQLLLCTERSIVVLPQPICSAGTRFSGRGVSSQDEIFAFGPPPVFRRLRFGVSDRRRVADDLLGYVLCFCVCVEVCRLPRKTVLADEFVTRRRWRHLDETGMCFVEFEDLFQAPQTALHLRLHLRYRSFHPGVLW